MNSEQRIESELSDGWLQVSTEISGTNPAEVLAAFYEPDRLRQRWGGELISDPLNDETYTVHFAQLEQTMRGDVTKYVPSEVFAFSWAWDHESEFKT